MRYTFKVFEDATGKEIFSAEVEGLDKQMCVIKAVEAANKSGLNLTRIGKSVQAMPLGKPSPYTFSMKQI